MPRRSASPDSLSLVGHFRSSLTHFLEGSAWGAELDKEFVEVVASELPFEGLSRSGPVVLKVQKALGDSVEIGKIIGRQDLRWTIEK
jgi:hypothetical protein